MARLFRSGRNRHKMDIVEKNRLEQLERIIQNGIDTFIEVGEALAQIKEEKLWEGEYESFDHYCKQRWDFGAANARLLMQSSEVAKSLPEPPTKSSHARILGSLGKEDRLALWQQIKTQYEEPKGWQIKQEVDKFNLKQTFLAEPLERGILSIQDAKQLKHTLDNLPPYYTKSIVGLKAWKTKPATLRAIRKLESMYKDDALGVLSSGYLYGNYQQIHIQDLTPRDIEYFINYMRRQEQPQPDHETIKYIFPHEEPNFSWEKLERQGYKPFLIIAHKDGEVNNIPLAAANGHSSRLARILIQQM